MDLKKETRRRWREGAFIETGAVLPASSYDHIPWVPYETYMRAQLVDCTSGQLGKLLVDFPADAMEDNELHVHPISDRLITVIRGSGEFVARRPSGTIEHFALVPGHRVWMPRGVLHTFMAGGEGLLVESLHNPFVPFDHPRCLVYPRNNSAASAKEVSQ